MTTTEQVRGTARVSGAPLASRRWGSVWGAGSPVVTPSALFGPSSMRSPKESQPRCRMGGHHVRLHGTDMPGRHPRLRLPKQESGKRGARSRLAGPGSAPVTPLVKWFRASSHPEASASLTQTATEVGRPQNRSAPRPRGTPAHKPTSGHSRLGAGLPPASGRWGSEFPH